MDGPLDLRRRSGARPFASALRDGNRFHERYRILRTAAFGGMSRIYEAEDEETGERVALKVLFLPNVDEIFTQRFEREIEILRTLRHPNLVRSTDSGRTEDGELFLALEWLDGADLGDRIRGGPLGVREGCEVMRATLRGLSAVHEAGIVHRDLKPANIFVSEGALPPSGVKLLDFGVAKLVDEHVAQSVHKGLTSAGMVVGTPFYMAPEQARGVGVVDLRADLYSIGAALFETITGHKVFTASSALALLVRIASEQAPRARSVRPDLPAAIDELLARALARDPDQRFQSALEMESALSDVLVDLGDEGVTMHAVRIEDLLRGRRGPSVMSADTAREQVDRPSISSGATEDILELDAELTLPPSDGTPPGYGVPPGLATAALVVDLAGAEQDREAARVQLTAEVEARGGVMMPVRGGIAIAMFEPGAGGDAGSRATEAALQALGLSSRLAADGFEAGEIRAAVASAAPSGDDPASGGEAAIDAACALLELVEAGEVLVDDATQLAFSGAHATVARQAGAHLLLPAEPSEPTPVVTIGRAGAARWVGDTAVLGRLLEQPRIAAREARPRCVLISGPPGSGKTRLRREWRQLMEREQPERLVLGASGDEAARTTPLATLADLLRRWGRIRRGDAAPSLADKLDRLLPRELPSARRASVAEILGRLLGDADPGADGGWARLVTEASRAIIDLLVARAHAGGLLLMIDDAQWADAVSLRTLLEIVTTGRGSIAVALFGRAELAAHHPELLEGLTAAPGGWRLGLEPLDRDGARQLASELLGAPVPTALLERLLARTRGNPQHLEELCLALVGSASPESQLERIGDGVAAAVRERSLMLTPEARRAAQAGAVLGARFPDLALRALGIAAPRAALDELIAGGWLEVSSASRYANTRDLVFRSRVLRDAIYAGIELQDGLELHAAAASWLIEAGELDPAVLARHFDAAADPDRAREALSEAARRALAAGDALGASTVIGEALRLGDAPAELRKELLGLAQDAEDRLGKYDAALGTLDALDQAEDGGSGITWREIQRGRMLLARGDSSAALRRFRDAHAQAEASGAHREAAWLLLGLGDAVQERGNTLEACTHYQRVYQLAKQRDDAALQAEGVLRLGRIAYATSGLAQAIRLYEDARRRFDELGDARGVGHALTGLGAAYAMAGDASRAVERLGAALRCHLAAPDRRGYLVARAYLAMAHYEGDAIAESHAELDALTRLTPSSGSRQPALLASLVALRGMLDGRHYARAADYARRMFETAMRSLPRFVVPLESMLGLALAHTGEIKKGLRHAEAAVARLESQKATEDEDPQRIYAHYAECLELAGQAAQAQKIWTQAATTMTEVESRLSTAMQPRFRRRAINHRILRRVGVPRAPTQAR